MWVRLLLNSQYLKPSHRPRPQPASQLTQLGPEKLSPNILQRYAQRDVRTPQGHNRTWIARRAEMGHFEQNDGPNLGTDHAHNDLGTIVHTQTLQDGRASGSCNQGAFGYATSQHQKRPVAEYLNAASLDGESTADHISNEGVMKDALDPQVEETTRLKSVWADFHRDLGAVNAVFGSASTEANGNALQAAGNVTLISHHVDNDGGGRGGAQNRNGSATISHQHTSTSLRITEMIELMDDGSSEVDSGWSEPPLVTVSEYRVKPENGGLLRSIFAKHGDIGAKSLLWSVRFRSFFMDCVCQFLQKLMTTSVLGIRQHEIQDMQAFLSEMEGQCMEVSWLKKELDDIFEAKQTIPRLKSSFSVRAEWENKFKMPKEQLHVYMAESSNKMVELHTLQMELHALEEKMCSAVQDLSDAEANAKKIRLSISKDRAKLGLIVKLKTLGSDLI